MAMIGAIHQIGIYATSVAEKGIYEAMRPLDEVFFANVERMNSKKHGFEKQTIMNDELKDLAEIMLEEHKKQVADWTKAKEELNGLIEPKYFDFAESHESYGSEGIVNIVEVKERTSGYSSYPHCREFGANERRLYIHHATQLETLDEESKYEGSDIEYWVWQTVGYCGDDYSGFLLLPMLDGRYWKISYSC